jgi:hypothetical protein
MPVNQMAGDPRNCESGRGGLGGQSSARASTAWVAIQGPGPNDIVQVGMGACGPIAGGGCNNAMQDGYAWGRTQSSPGCSAYTSRAPTGTWLGAWSPGGIFQITEAANHSVRMTTPKFVVTLQGASACWTNRYVSLFNESFDFGDALGGTSLAPFWFASKSYQQTAGGAWFGLASLCNARNPLGLETVFRCAPAGDRIQTWTAR